MSGKRRPRGAAVAGQVDGERSEAVMGEPPALQRPHAVVHPRAVQEDDERRGLVSCARPPVEAKTALPSTSKRIAPPSALLRGAQRLFEVGDDVGSRLEADRQPDQVLADPGGGELFGVHLLMGGRSGMDHQRLRVADIGQMAGELQRLDELAPRRPAAPDAER